MNNSDPEHIDPNNIQSGPIRNDSLPPELLERIRAVYDVIGKYISNSLEQFEIGFMRDTSPEDEVIIWSSIAAAWLDYHEKYLGDELLSDEEEKKLIGTLVAISTGVENVTVLPVPPDVGKKLLDCYDGLSME
ncbi:hypothetical protein C5Y96_18990 [Blastopirellula marina]|uniref:Uncharacterized protein n=1 Tax=Blastopirellula marina TaxID=124 RepID=A0A2S8F6Q0_9BACT|nr:MULTISPECIES: hypothetical protein [Pirellulaceae]PQO27614.1 hypothetical protein C5Y96_18990 [Blastopirellula marina]RCS48151.1 hypothetical protein DTL36_19015 [Bremerella cremea]